MAFYTVFQQISVLAILALIGIIGVKTKIFADTARSVIEKLVFYITLPLLIVTKLSNLEITNEILNNGAQVILFTYLILFIQIGVGRISAKVFKLHKPQAVIHAMHTFLGNIVFLGFPLLDALFPGGEAILYAALYQLVMNTVLWTYGIVQLSPESSGNMFGNFKKLFNPNTIALLIAMVMLLLRIKLPEILQISLGGLGRTTLYLAMIYIGILLSKTNLWSTLRKADVLFISFSKLLLIPTSLIFFFQFIFIYTPLSINNTAFSVLILEAAMPCMTILVILAKRYGADDQKAMENFVVSTVISVLSLPIILILLNKIPALF